MRLKSKVVWESGPKPGNPRNSEGSMVELADGSLLFVYSCYTGEEYADEAVASLASIRSSDGGESWSTPQLFIGPERFGALNVMSPTILRLASGKLALFFMVRHGWHDNRTHMCISIDEGEHFSEPVCCIRAPGYFVTNNDRVIQTASGRLIVPAAYHRLKSEDVLARGAFDSRGISFFYYSDDEGLSWSEAPSMLSSGSSLSSSGLQEPGVYQCADGHLWAYFRTDLGVQYQSVSFDDGLTWSDARASKWVSPCSPLSVKAVGPSGTILAIYNPVNRDGNDFGYPGWGRTPLVMRISCDDARSFGPQITIEDDPESGYCYTSITPTSHGVFIAYCAGGAQDEGVCLRRLRMRKISYEELTELKGNSV